MLPLHPQYLKDSEGNNSFVVLTVDEFEAIVEKLEDLEDVRIYNEAKREEDGERISFSDYLKSRHGQ
ncbi:hypothetical protein [Mucilaginibacter psychrotolerans]|uniref:Prevent-host-death family protein n=1 Tax=Mucilaginibacter psychrotolerans TaxID=1524096 RepID=A0A4Y8SR49_9SPHI|nr:hypothetical protein [Mucilaginibacter psychrotolerans]TFF40937.1 hypothetical protein E2R66_01815 [Mucilaginibacter psychrotolerans]